MRHGTLPRILDNGLKEDIFPVLWNITQWNCLVIDLNSRESKWYPVSEQWNRWEEQCSIGSPFVVSSTLTFCNQYGSPNLDSLDSSFVHRSHSGHNASEQTFPDFSTTRNTPTSVFWALALMWSLERCLSYVWTQVNTGMENWQQRILMRFHEWK